MRQREGVFRLARFLIPEAIDAVYRQGRLPPERVPNTWNEHAAHPLGRELLCLSVRLGQLKKALAGSDDARAGIALKLLQDLVRLHSAPLGRCR